MRRQMPSFSPAAHSGPAQLPGPRKAVVTISDIVDSELAVAAALEAGGCGGDYLHGAILTTALLSGMASDLWPGKGKDKKRFVELWVSYLEPDARLVSLPLLVQSL